MLQLSIVWVNADLKVIDEYDVYIKPPDSAEWGARRIQGQANDHEASQCDSTLRLWKRTVTKKRTETTLQTTAITIRT